MRVLGVGYCTLDQIAVVDRFAEPDFKVEMAKFSVQGGGTAATAIALLARWGIETSFAGKVGDDARATQIAKTLSNEGVDTAAMVHEAGAISQLTFIVVEEGTGRKQTYFTQGNVSDLRADEIDLNLLDGVDLLLVDDRYPLAQIGLVQAARERGIPVVLEVNRMAPGVAELVGVCDYLVASERFATQFTGMGQLGSMCRSLLERGPKSVVVTLGDEGSVALAKGQERLLRQSAYEVEVVDTTGAGDVFLGAFVYGILQGWELSRQVGVANIAAGLCCKDVGGRGAIATLAQIEALL
ncbi:MAG: hypothetical protein H0U74_05755 [Bradymonadaceae bacterium]|nr:hypothetical protein [Lujinxingiaceae bacterium]